MDHTALNKMDLLLVDDRIENLITLEAVLTSPQYNLIKATSGDEALRYLLDHNPILILMDVQMPGLDGFETASILKRSERTREIPIIFITAINKDERFVHQGYSYGAVDYIYKPYDAHILRSKVSVFAELAQKTIRLLKAEKHLRENENKERERQVALLELISLKREQADHKKYRDLVDGINHGIVWSANAETLSIGFVSTSAKRILGYSLDSWAADPNFFSNHLHPDDRDSFLNAIQCLKTDLKEVTLEHRFIAANNRKVWLNTGLKIARKADGASYEIRGLSIDISKMKRTEEALLKSSKRSLFLAEAGLLLSESLDYEATLAKIGTLIVPKLADWYSIDTADENGEQKRLAVALSDKFKSTLTNESIERLSPAHTEENIRQVLKTGKPKLYANLSIDLSQKRERNKKSSFKLEVPVLKSAMIVPLIARGKTTGAITFLSFLDSHHYDDEDLRMAEDLAHRIAVAIDNAGLYRQAQAAIDTRNEFLSIASHELKTPLTPLKIQVQMLLRTLRTDSIESLSLERLKSIAQTSDRQITKLSHLIEDLLDISKLTERKLNLELCEFDLIELIREIIDRYSSQMSKAGCSIEFLPTESIMVRWDRFRIEQVITNLLTNAIKYGPGKPLCIAVSVCQSVVRLSFQDQGIGIARKDHERIFGRFERAAASCNFGGLGLGLYIVQQILKTHGGKISVQSELNKGSTFTVELPINAESEANKSQTPAA